MSSRSLYVGNLPGDIREREVDDLFYKYGPIMHIELKVPPGFAFVEFEDARDADDAIRGRDGHRLRVELAHGTSSSRDRFRRSDYICYDSRQSRSLSGSRTRSRSRSRSRRSLSKSAASPRSGTKRGGSLSTVTRSKAAPKLEIPHPLWICICLALEAEKKLKTRPNDEGLLITLSMYKRDIGNLADQYKENGQLPSDWEYHPDTASSCVPIKAPMMASKHQIPVGVYYYVNLVFYNEQRLKKRPGDEVLSQRLEYYKQRLDTVADSYKKKGQLPSDWEYDYDTASSYEPIKHYYKVPKKPEKNIPPNPHIHSVPLADGAKVAWQEFKEFDESIKKPTLLGLPCPMDEEMDEEIFTRLRLNVAFITIILDFAVDVFNKSCQMYRNKNNNNNKNISNAKVKECKYAKVQPCYLFYMTIEVFEQEKIEVYEVNLRCDLDDGATVLDSFCLGGPEPLGIREGAHISLESIYETPKDDSLTDPEVYYYTSGMVRRTGGYDFYNPLGWDAISEWYD